MNKKKIFLSMSIFFIVFASFSAIYAFTTKIDLTNLNAQDSDYNSNEDLYICAYEKNETISNSQQNDLLSTASNYIPILLNSSGTQLISTLNDSPIEFKTFYDNTINENYYDIIENNYTISLSEDSELRAFSDNTFDFDTSVSTNRELAESYITQIYQNLNLSDGYELAYLEIFDDSMWEANFVKKIDGIYNYYDSIKVFFSPNQGKIAALRVHSTTYNNSEISTVSTNISENDIINIMKENFSDINNNDITDIELVFTKPNNFFTRQAGTDVIFENYVVKAWKVTIEKNNTTTFAFIDYNTGNIVGGDQIK